MTARSFLPALLLSLAAVACGDGGADVSSGATSSSGSTGAGGESASATTSASSGAGGDGDVTASVGAGGESSSTSGEGGAGGSSTATTGSGGSAEGCPEVPACDAAPPDPGAAQDWNNVTSYVVVASGAANHRGRDLFLNPGDPQWVIAKFAYGLADKDLVGENVDAYLLRDCGTDWELLGSTITTDDGEHATEEGVEDTGGRVYLKIPQNKKLGLGRHRVHLVVRGDLSSTDVFLDVVEAGTPVFVSDVDGTLTTTENAEFGALLTGVLPSMNPDAAAAHGFLAAKGYHPLYLTARPEWLVQRTREFLDTNGFPPGIVHTTLTFTGALGGNAVTYKTDELAMLGGKGIVPTYAFGNTASDADAYENTGIQPLASRIFFQFDDAHGGRRIDAYTELLGEFGALPFVCP